MLCAAFLSLPSQPRFRTVYAWGADEAHDQDADRKQHRLRMCAPVSRARQDRPDAQPAGECRAEHLRADQIAAKMTVMTLRPDDLAFACGGGLDVMEKCLLGGASLRKARTIRRKRPKNALSRE